MQGANDDWAYAKAGYVGRHHSSPGVEHVLLWLDAVQWAVLWVPAIVQLGALLKEFRGAAIPIY